jgi:hypothetical protein
MTRISPAAWKRSLAALTAAWACLAAGPASADADHDLRSFATYAVLREVAAANPSGRLAAEDASRIAAADAAIGINRSTAAFGGGPSCTRAPAPVWSVAEADSDEHAFVPESHRYLPATYLRDYVRGTLAGMTGAVNSLAADAAVSRENKNFVLGEYLHLVQDIALNQQAGVPQVGGDKVGGDKVAGETGSPADRLLQGDGSLSDAALRALSETYAAATAFARTGVLPAVQASDKFEHEFYDPLTAADKTRIIKTLRDAGIYRYLDPATGFPTARAAVAAATWTTFHPGTPPFLPPDAAPDGADIVAYDAHPEWLVPQALRRPAAGVRLVMEDAVLAQQQGARLRASVARLQTAKAASKDMVAAARLSMTVDALSKAADEGDAALKQAGSGWTSDSRQSALALAQSLFGRGNRDAATALADFVAAPAKPRILPCILDAQAVNAAMARITAIAQMTASAAIGSEAGAGLSAADRKTCGANGMSAVISLFDGSIVQVPPQCRGVVRAARENLDTYTRSHIDRSDPVVEAMLSLTVRRK